MKRSNRLILLIGVFLAIVAFIGIVFVFNGNQNPTPGVSPTVAVVVAARDIPVGNQIVKDDLTTKTIQTTDKPADAFGDPSLVLGHIARADVKSGQIITRSATFNTDTLGTNSQQVVSSLTKGLRAVAVQVDQVTGVGTIVQTGDRVDVIVSVRVQQLVADPQNPGSFKDFPGGPQLSVKTVIQNVKVVGTLLPPPTAAQQQQQQPAASPAAGGTSTTGATTTLNGQQEIVIVAVTPQQAEVIRYAQLGAEPMTLTLRATQDKGSPPDATTGVVLKTLIDQYGVIPPFPPIATTPR